MHLIRTDKSGFGMLFVGASIFIFLCTVPGMLAAGAFASMDSLLLSCLLGGAIFAVLVALGHGLLRRTGSGSKAWYAAVGALALVLAYAARMDFNSLLAVVQRGMVAYFFFLPAVAGASFGFLYAHRAGWERDDPSLVEAGLATQDRPASASEPALVETDTAAYFAGPLRVRTSFLLMLLSSLIGGGVLFMCRALVVLVGEARMLSDHSAPAVLKHAADASLYVGAEMLFMTLLGIVPISLCLIAGHFAARGLKAKAVWVYFLIGFVTPVAVAMLSMGLFAMIAITVALPTAISMALYRTFAGLEPVPIAEDVIVSDSRALVGAEHPRRRYGRIIVPGQEKRASQID